MQLIQNNKLLTFINFAVGFFFLSALSVKGGYNYSPVLLMLIGLGFIIHSYAVKKQKWTVSVDEKRLIFSYVFYFSLFLLSLLIHGDRLRELDNPSRILFLLPLLFLFRHFPLRFNILHYCIPAGAAIAGIVALYDRFYLHSPMAFSPRIMHIQGGDIAMSFGMFSLVLSLYFAIKTQLKPTALCFLAALFGILGSFLSTARGGWIGVPFIVLFILWSYRCSFSKKFFTSVLTVITLLIITAVSIPQTRIMERIEAAKNEIAAYISHDNGSTSVGARFDMWESSLLMAKEKPIFGWGVAGVTEKRKEQHQQGLISEFATQFNHAHNQFLDDLSKRGIFGLLALLGVLFVPLHFFWRNIKSDVLEVKTVAILGSVHCLSVIFYSLSQGFFTHNSGSIFYFFLVVVFYGLLHSLKSGQLNRTE